MNTTNKIRYAELAQLVRRGIVVKLRSSEITQLQNYSLDIKDIPLYDKLERMRNREAKETK